MEHKARKYCLLYKEKPSYAISCIYKDLSQNLINGLTALLLDWCLYAAESSDAFVDLMIPIDCNQLHDFIEELLSTESRDSSIESRDSLITARAIRILKNQNASMTSLVNLTHGLRRCPQSVDVLVLLSVINARIGRDKECLRYLGILSATNELISLRARLYLLSIADLQLLKLTMESSLKLTIQGVRNNAYSRENSTDSIENNHNQSSDPNSVTSATKDLYSSETPKSENIRTEMIYNEVAIALWHLNEAELNLDVVLKTHLDAGRPYIACWLSLKYYNDNEQPPALSEATVKSLHAFLLSAVNQFLEISKREDEKESALSESLGILHKRAVKYCHLALQLRKEDQKTNILLLKCLFKSKQISEALALGQSLLNSDNCSTEVLQVVCYCKIFLEKYHDALDLINTTARDFEESICVRGFALCLAGRAQEGINDIISACKNDISTTVINYKSLKADDKEKLKYYISDYITEDIGFQKTDQNQLEYGKSSQNRISYDNTYTKSHYQDQLFLCELLTKLYKKDLEVHLFHARVLLKLHRYSDAQRTLVLFIKRTPGHPLPMIHLANLRMQLGAYVAAVEDFRAIIRAIGCEKFAENLTQLSDNDRNDIARVLRQHGFQHLQYKRHADAIECFDIAIIALGEMAAGLILVRAFSFANLGDCELALKDFNAVLEREPENVATRVGRSVMYAVLGYEEESLDNMSVLLSEHRDTSIKVLQKLPWEHVRQFTTAIESFVNKAVEIDLDKALGEEKRNLLYFIGIYVEFLSFLYHQSPHFISMQVQYYIMSGDYEGALDRVNMSLKSTPDEPQLTSKKGLVKAKMSKIQEAIDVLRAIPTDNIDVIKNDAKQLTSEERGELVKEALYRAEHLSSAMDYGGAKEYYDLALAIVENENKVEILRGRFACLVNEGFVQDALSDITLVIEKKPTYHDYCVRAKLLDSMGKEKTACLDFITALELDEDNTVAFLIDEAMLKHVLCMFCTASSSAFVREQHQEVLKFCEYGLKLDPNHKGMKQLRYRTKCVMNKCVVQ